MPIEPELQRLKIIHDYERNFAAGMLKFTDKIKDRTFNLMGMVSD